ncbi:hypothetical protein HS088_TW08G00398 [Tripterygium wilfordii]|uniref:Uncharacterized protein n=1 Tax=Tripterygium wilfordii TaxID=458696 RepID=A0A7J7DBT3_TRIWF|nr:auxin-responsive protein SAUR78-like [Tripterygium wilfordii]KAF5743810.1 hypothetical protein HS088_TW08G00398 [Tripterygium wilfordii]
MAKTGKLRKLKSAIKRWPSLSKLGCASSSIAAASSETEDNPIAAAAEQQEELQAVYVGKSRRRYLLSWDTICHPLFQELIERSGGFNNGDDDDSNEVVVACEVVLFEHLLWMLDNGGSDQLDELVDFYTC